MSNEVSVIAAGDICIKREDAVSIFDKTKDMIQDADITFCQLETTLCHEGSPQRHARGPERCHPRCARAIADCGFDVVSFASNHALDFGNEVFIGTIDALKENNLLPVGVGANIDEARKPVFVEKKGLKVAFLAYNSILPKGYWAETRKPGCAPLRAHTIYTQFEEDQPGTPCITTTFCFRDDLQAMLNDIRKAREEADVVLVSIHWGIHIAPSVLADYQTEAGHAAIDAGADAIFGSHPHILKGIEVYKDKPIFYSLANFAFEEFIAPEFIASPSLQEMIKAYDWDIPEIIKEYPAYPFPVDSRKSVVAKLSLGRNGVSKITCVPLYILPDASPETLKRSDPRAREVFDYLKEITENENLNAKFSWDGDEILVES